MLELMNEIKINEFYYVALPFNEQIQREGTYVIKIKLYDEYKVEVYKNGMLRALLSLEDAGIIQEGELFFANNAAKVNEPMSKHKAYSLNLYVMDNPMYTENWTDDDYIKFIDRCKGWLVAVV